MSILGLFDIGKSALFASQAALSVTSNNIANVNTPGYSRQAVVLNIANPVITSAGTIGRGVATGGVMRSYDLFVQAQLLSQQQSQGRSAAMDETWSQIEQVLNEQQGMGLSTPLAEYFNAWSDVASNPDSQVPRTILLQKAGALIRSAATLESTIVSTIRNANAGIADTASQINAIAADIAVLNERIMQSEAGQTGATANDLRDQRDVKLTELAKLTDFTSYEGSNGSLTVVVAMRNLVSGATTNAMTSTMNSSGDYSIQLDGINITDTVQGGRLAGLIASRNDVQTVALNGLRRLVASVTKEVNTLHQQGFGLDGSTGNLFFNPLQLTAVNNSAAASVTATITNPDALALDEYDIGFNGGNYTVSNKQTGAIVTTGAYNPAGTTVSLPPSPPAALSGMDVTISGPVTNADSFIVSPLITAVGNFKLVLTDARQVAGSSTALGVPGNNDTALQISGLSSAAVSDLKNTSFASYYNGTVSTVGAMKRSSTDGLEFDNNLMAELQTRRDSISGVSLDEEAANLLRYQRSYEAGARMIRVADELLQTILNL